VAWPQFDAAEVSFWHRLRDALAGRDLQLVLASTSTPPSTLHVPHLPAIPTIDAYWPPRPLQPGASLAAIGLTAPALLAREAAWGAPSLLPAIDSYRRRAMDAVTEHWFQTMAALEPAAVAIWNGQHTTEMILEAVCRACAVPTLYVERAPIPQALFADERGLSAASAVAAEASWPVAAVEWEARADAVVRWLKQDRRTWWDQPASRGAAPGEMRRQLDVPDAARVILFAAQVDQDTQQFLFSPHFDRNLAAFAWLLDRLDGRDDVFVLGKHHPKSRTSPAVYERALADRRVRGAWCTDLSVDDALAVADRVAAVNSTVLYEALAQEKPVLAMGQWLLGGRGAAWEIDDLSRGAEVVDAWLQAGDRAERQAAWRRSLASLLSRCLYTYQPELEGAGVPGAAALATRMATLAARGERHASVATDRWIAAQAAAPSWTVPGDDPGVHDARDWQGAHALRHALLEAVAAVERGRRIVVWGAGAGGRAADALLAQAGARAAAFVSSSPDRSHVDGRELLSPADLGTSPRDFVLVASRAAHEIVPALAALGFAPGEDYHVLSVDDLVALARR
jgi:hypothetical protein